MKKRILIVDDELDILEVVKSGLERSKFFEVLSAKDGQDALEKIAAESPDLIVLDVMMPKVSGDEVLKKIRENIKTMDIPVIVSTVNHDVSSLVKFMNLGATDYLIKPYDIQELSRLISTYI